MGLGSGLQNYGSAFNLSPSVTVREYDLSLTIKELPSSRTGFVLRSDHGEAMTITPITSERELVDAFGPPTNLNYEDWFNVWNFLQYSGSAFVVRPMPLVDEDNTVLQVGVFLDAYRSDPSDASTEDIHKAALENFEIGRIPTGMTAEFSALPSDVQDKIIGDENMHPLYNKEFAEIELGKLAINHKLMFLNRYATSVQNLAVTVCSYKEDWTKPITADTSVVYDPSLQTIDGSNIITFSEVFDYEPDWSNDEFAVIVLKKNSLGLYEIVEKAIVSYKEGAKDVFGRNIFVEDYFFHKSKYLYAKVGNIDDGAKLSTVENNVADLAIKPVSIYSTYPRAGTTLDDVRYTGAYDSGDIDEAFELFANSEDFDINILVAHKLNINKAPTIAASRRDCLAIVAPYEYDDIVGHSASEATDFLVKNYGTRSDNWLGRIFNTFNSYTGVFGNVKYQYDKYNDVNRWVNLAGDVAGLMAQTVRDRDPWWATAGLERGKIKNAIKLGFNPKRTNRDELYINAINPVISVPGEGSAIIWGQKTAVTKPSAFDRINVRRLLITIEKAIASASRYALFEFNDAFTRARIKGMIDPYLRDVQGRRGIYDFLVVCDESNNTGQVIDNNELVIDIYVKPERVAEFILINVNVTRTDANFKEIIGGNIPTKG